MSITFNCSCGECLEVDDELAGRPARCPYCEAVVSVPVATPSPRARRAKLVDPDETADDRGAYANSLNPLDGSGRPSSRGRPVDEPDDRPRRRAAYASGEGDEDDDRPRRRRRAEPPPYNLLNNQVVGGSIAVFLSVSVVVAALFFDTFWYGMLFVTAAGLFSLVRGLITGRNG